jgi:hypothetical protein
MTRLSSPPRAAFRCAAISSCGTPTGAALDIIQAADRTKRREYGREGVLTGADREPAHLSSAARATSSSSMAVTFLG